MEVKSIDALLNELNNVQLSKESMSGITGGWSVEYTSKTGKVVMRYSDVTGKLVEIRLKGFRHQADELIAAGDDHE